MLSDRLIDASKTPQKISCVQYIAGYKLYIKTVCYENNTFSICEVTDGGVFFEIKYMALQEDRKSWDSIIKVSTKCPHLHLSL